MTVRVLARAALLLWSAATVAGLVWTLSTHPFAHPFIDRGTAEVRLALDRAMARAVTPGWLLPRLDAAIAAGDPDRVDLLRDLARDHGIALPEATAAQAAQVIARRDGFLATGSACLACMAEMADCPSLRLLGACAIPFELTPFGDVNELRRQGMRWWRDEDVDEVGTTLAAVGLTASVVALPSLGASVPVKLGASVLRIAHRARALGPGMERALRGAARDSGGAARLGAMAADATRIAVHAGPADALAVLRIADDPADLARLARITEVAGKDSRKAVEVLGKTRVLRLLSRASAMVLAAFGLAAMLAAQIGTLAVQRALRRLIRPARA